MKNTEKCRSWEENTYWNHFHSLHFFQILPSNFHHHLNLPRKFTGNEIGNLPANVIVKGPNGIIWHVNLLSNDSNHVMLIGDVWKEFVKAYSLQKNDLLIFKYDRIERSFEVLFFDQTNSCERESSYFLRKCEQPRVDDGLDEQAKSDSFEYIICSSSDSTSHTDDDLDDEKDKDEPMESSIDRSTLKQQSSLNEDELTPKEVPSNCVKKIKVTGFNGDESNKRRAFIEDDSITKNISLNVNDSNSTKIYSRSAVCDSDRDYVPLCVKMRRKSSSVAAAACYRSNIRHVTEAEKDKALVLATKYATPESFIMVMRPSHVYKRFSLVIPRNWKPKGFSRDRRQDVILRTNNNTWVVSFCTSNNHGYGGFEGGWKKFALDNSLEEFDLCLFVPSGQENKCFVLDVSIFGVVPEITPLSPVHNKYH